MFRRNEGATDQGQGPPVVLIPGIQGRWEWMAPAVRALSAQHRVLTFSLSEAPGPALFDQWVDLIDRLLARTTEPGSAVVGISFGGLVAAYYAAMRPSRVTRLVLVSAPSPRWQLDARSASYVKRPVLSLPLFAGRAIGRIGPELFAALPTMGRRASFVMRHAGRAVRFPPSPGHMAACVRAWEETDLVGACRRVNAPTLVITGEPSLDRVVPVTSSLDYLSLISNARHVTFEHTGHLGLVLQPREFARLVTDFLEDTDRERDAVRTGRSA